MSAKNPSKKSALATRRAIAALRELVDGAGPAALPRDDALKLAELVERLRPRLEPSAAGSAPCPPLPQSDPAARVYFDYALTGIIETDQHWRVVRANPAAASITGHDVKALCGSELPALTCPASAARVERHLSLLREQGISQAEWRLRRRDGREISIEIASMQIDDEHFTHVFDDVTVQRQAVAEIERARAAAEAANRAKSDFLANVSHEIRTPLNGIIGLSQLALLTKLDAPQRDYLEKIAQSGRTLLRIINDLLDTAKLESGRMEFEALPFALEALLDDISTLRTQARDEKGLEVVFDVAAGVPRYLLGDRLRLGQCLRNLLGNAIKFTPAGRVELRVDISGEESAQWLNLCVVDSGIGIAPEALARLFSPFNQADSSTARRFGGTGLGLFITREMARGMGGELHVSSSAGVGSRFTLTLPLCVADAPTPQPETLALQPSEVPQEFRGRHILVAEDDKVNQLIILQWLSHAGIIATLAQDGREALARVAEMSPAPDLVLMDVQMPDMDGLEATRRLREGGYIRPVVGLSAGASPHEQEACAAAGMSDFIAKPIDIDELWGCLTRWLPPVDASVTQSAGTPSGNATTISVEARFLHNHEILAQARAAFIDSHGADAAQLRALLAQGEGTITPAMMRQAHGLKGSAATLGLDTLAALAHELEDGSALPHDRIDSLIRQIDEQLIRTRAAFGSTG